MILLALAGCSSTNEGSTSSVPRSPSGDAAVAVADAGPKPAVVGAAPSGALGLSLVLEGTCSAPRVFAVGTSRAWAVAGAAYTIDGGEPKLLGSSMSYNDLTGEGVDRVARIDRIGGADLEHAWILRMAESRSSPVVRLSTRTANGAWKGAEPVNDLGFGGTLYEHPSGALWIVSNEMYLGSRFEEYVDGALVKKAKMPKTDMVGDEYGFMPDGELLVVGGTIRAKELKRWSPTHPVDDVVVTERVAEVDALSLRIQRPPTTTPRVVVGVASASAKTRALLDWKNEKLVPVAMSNELTAAFSWDLASDGTLYALRADGTLLRETATGEVSKLVVGAAGKVVAGATSAPWIITKHGTLYRFDGKGTLTELPLPAGGWELSSFDAPQAKSVTVLGQDEAYVTATRVERDAGWKKPRISTVVYATTAAPKRPLRCGAPLASDAVYAFPPPARDACSEPTVVLEKSIKPAALAKLIEAAPLTWGPPKGERLAVRAPSLPEAGAWVEKLAKAGHDAEVVCGAPSWTAPAPIGK